MDSLISIASIATPSTKRRIQIFRNEIPFIISNGGPNDSNLGLHFFNHLLLFLNLFLALLFFLLCNLEEKKWFSDVKLKMLRILVLSPSSSIFPFFAFVCVQFDNEVRKSRKYNHFVQFKRSCLLTTTGGWQSFMTAVTNNNVFSFSRKSWSWSKYWLANLICTSGIRIRWEWKICIIVTRRGNGYQKTH